MNISHTTDALQRLKAYLLAIIDKYTYSAQLLRTVIITPLITNTTYIINHTH